MRIYNVPVQLDREDRIFGGRISLRQFIYLVIGTGIGAAIFLSVYRAKMEAGVLAWAFWSGLGCFMAFFKVREVDVDKYILMLLRFKLTRKKYPYRGGGS
jgi:hypothetical protein